MSSDEDDSESSADDELHYDDGREHRAVPSGGHVDVQDYAQVFHGPESSEVMRALCERCVERRRGTEQGSRWRALA